MKPNELHDSALPVFLKDDTLPCYKVNELHCWFNSHQLDFCKMSRSSVSQYFKFVHCCRCVLFELFTDGRRLFDLSQLLAYRTGKYNVERELQHVEDESAQVHTPGDTRIGACECTVCVSRL